MDLKTKYSNQIIRKKKKKLFFRNHQKKEIIKITL